MHQAMTAAQGQASDIEIRAREILRVQDRIRQIISDTTGQPYDRIARDSDRDFFMTAEEAKDYGIVDEIIMKDSDKEAEMAKAS